MLMAPLLQALRCRCPRVNSLFKDRGSVLERGVKVFKRRLVNEVLGLHLTELFPDPTHKGATPIQRVVKLIRHSAPPDIWSRC